MSIIEPAIGLTQEEIKEINSYREEELEYIKQKSNCCKEDIRTEGKTTRYYVCNKCNKACDLF